MNRLEGKWALVTGSTRGIGQQIILALAKEGCNVIIHGRKIKNAEKTLEMIKDFSVDKRVVEAELSSDAGVDKLIDCVVSEVGSVDIIFNNAGIQNGWKGPWDISMKEWREIFEINLFSIAKINNYFIPKMIEKGWGRVINTSSGIEKIPEMIPYAASKAAIDKYTLDLIPAFENSDVKMFRLDPGWLKTDLGGPEAEFEVETVIPGALAPLFEENKIENGAIYHAHNYK